MSNIVGTALALIAWSAPWNMPLSAMAGPMAIGGVALAIEHVVKKGTRRDPRLRPGPIKFTRAKGRKQGTLGYKLPGGRSVKYTVETRRWEGGQIGMTCRLIGGEHFGTALAVARRPVSSEPPGIIAVARTTGEVRAMARMALTIRRNDELGIKDPVAAVGCSFRGGIGHYTVVAITPSGGGRSNAVIRRRVKKEVSFVSFDYDSVAAAVLVREPVKVGDDPDPAMVAAYADAIGQISGLPGVIDYTAGLRFVIALLEAGDHL